MKNPLQLGLKPTAAVLTLMTLVFAAVVMKYGFGQSADAYPPQSPSVASNAAPSHPTVDLSPNQLASIKLEEVGTRPFCLEKSAIGSIDYDQDLLVQVFSPYPGKIIAAFANLGDEVKKGQPLYTIASPDLIQAESSLIAAAATHALTSKELERVKGLYGATGVSERELEQATSDQQTAEGALSAARDAVRLYGKTDAEIDQIASSRKIDPALVVRCPVTGRVTARNAQQGLLVQPGNAPAPYSVGDLSIKWMVANVTETDSPLFHAGQSVAATLLAYPGRVFEGRISALGEAVDPNTHRVMVRCEIADPRHELRPGMLATFEIRVKDPVDSAAVPVNGVVRENDGTMVVWATTDRHRFVRKVVKLGLQKEGRYQVLEGVRRGELVVADGAIFLSNMLLPAAND